MVKCAACLDGNIPHLVSAQEEKCMMFLRILFILSILTSCSSSGKEALEKEIKIDKIEKDSILPTRIVRGEFTDVIKSPKNPKEKSDIRIEFAFYDPEGTLLPFEKTVNDLIIERVLPQKKEAYKKSGRIESYWFDEQLTGFKKECLSELKEIPEMSLWYLDQGITIDETYHDFVVLSTGQDVYAGGAHGSVYLTYDLIDRESGKALKLKDIVADLKGFTKIAEKYFRKTNEIDPSQSLEDAGYWFEDGFYCSENFYFEGEKMVFIYNQYEVAPYVMGMPGIEIPLKEIKSYLRISLLKNQ